MHLHRCSRCDGPNDWDGRSFDNICPECWGCEQEAAADYARDEAMLRDLEEGSLP